MAYTLGSAKDSIQAKGQTEADFMTRFNARRAEIENYKRMHGGDLEGAYQAVTGEPWPAGRSVKISHGAPEMTKDRTVKSVLSKYVAPIGAGALTALTLGGAAPALAGMFGGGGAAGGAGAAGTAATAGGGVVGGGIGTGALAAGAAIPGAGAASGIGATTGLGSILTAGGKKLAGAAVDKFTGKGQGGGGTVSAVDDEGNPVNVQGQGPSGQGTNWGDLLSAGGESLVHGAASSAAEDAANNIGKANWLNTMDDAYKTRVTAANAVPADLHRQALWNDFLQNEQTSNPSAPRTGLMTPEQQAMAAAQKEQILTKLKTANSVPLPTPAELPTYSEPGAGTKFASTAGNAMNFASKVPWGKIPWGKVGSGLSKIF